MAERVQVVIEDMDSLIGSYKDTLAALESDVRLEGATSRVQRALATQFRRTVLLLSTARLEILQLRLERATAGERDVSA